MSFSFVCLLLLLFLGEVGWGGGGFFDTVASLLMVNHEKLSPCTEYRLEPFCFMTSPLNHISTAFLYTSFRLHTGGELLQVDSQASENILKQLWHYSDAIMCCSVKANVSSPDLNLSYFSLTEACISFLLPLKLSLN